MKRSKHDGNLTLLYLHFAYLLSLVDGQESNISNNISAESRCCSAIQANLKRVLDRNRSHVATYMWAETASSY